MLRIAARFLYILILQDLQQFGRCGDIGDCLGILAVGQCAVCLDDPYSGQLHLVALIGTVDKAAFLGRFTLDLQAGHLCFIAAQFGLVGSSTVKTY